MRRRWLLPVAIVVLLVALVATLNGLVDPRDEFYSGAPLTAALESHCLLADDVVGERSHDEFKEDLFRRRRPKTVLLGGDRTVTMRGSPGESFLNVGFPHMSAEAVADIVGSLTGATTGRRRITLYIATEPGWFDAGIDRPSFRLTTLERAGYLLSPWTLTSSLRLLRRSRTLAFRGWTKETAGRACVVDRGSPRPSWRPDGSFVGAPPPERPVADGHGFAWHELTPIDEALSLAARRRWRVVGFSPPGSLDDASEFAETYRRELTALFAKHRFRWLDWSDVRDVPCREPGARCTRRMRLKLDAAAHS